MYMHIISTYTMYFLCKGISVETPCYKVAPPMSLGGPMFGVQGSPDIVNFGKIFKYTYVYIYAYIKNDHILYMESLSSKVRWEH